MVVKGTEREEEIMFEKLGGLILFGVFMTVGITRANLLANGDFSSWISPTQPVAWIVEDSTKARIERSADTTHSMPYAVRITRLVTGTGNNYGLKQFVPVNAGAIYTLSAWYFDDDVNARGGIVITWCRGDSSAIRSTTVAYTDSAIHTWQRLVRSDTAPDSTVFAKCLLRVYGFPGGPAGGVMYADDAEFYEGAGGVLEKEPGRRRGVLLNAFLKGTENVQINLMVDRPLSGRLDVYNQAGFKCVKVWQGSLAPGNYVFSWDGKDGKGQLLAPGVYFVMFEGPAVKPQTKKLILNR